MASRARDWDVGQQSLIIFWLVGYNRSGIAGLYFTEDPARIESTLCTVQNMAIGSSYSELMRKDSGL